MELSIPPKGGEEGIKDLLLTIGLDLGTLFVILCTIRFTGEMAFSSAAYLGFTLYVVRCGSGEKGDGCAFAPLNDRYRHGPYLPGLSGRTALAKWSSEKSQSGHNDPQFAFFLWPSFFRANESNTPTTCTLSASARFRCSC